MNHLDRINWEERVSSLDVATLAGMERGSIRRAFLTANQEKHHHLVVHLLRLGYTPKTIFSWIEYGVPKDGVVACLDFYANHVTIGSRKKEALDSLQEIRFQPQAPPHEPGTSPQLELELKADWFENLRQVLDGVERWSSRKLFGYLGYSSPQSFNRVIDKAKSYCWRNGMDVGHHFEPSGITVRGKKILDDMLTLTACRVVLMSADQSKPEIQEAKKLIFRDRSPIVGVPPEKTNTDKQPTQGVSQEPAQPVSTKDIPSVQETPPPEPPSDLELQLAKLLHAATVNIAEITQELAELRNEVQSLRETEPPPKKNKTRMIGVSLVPPSGYHTVAGYLQDHNLEIPNQNTAKDIGKEASKLCHKSSRQIYPISHKKYDKVNSYPDEILAQVVEWFGLSG